MDIRLAEMIWLAVAGYAGAGAVVALALCVGLLRRFDPLAATAPWHVKLILAPGMMLLWPVMLVKLVLGRRVAP
jgi:hypothetical protein